MRYVTIAPAPSTLADKNEIFSRLSGLWLWSIFFVTYLFCFQNTLAANAELANALNEKNRDWRKLKHAVELKDGQIASLEEARKKDEGELSLLSSHPTSRQHFLCSDNPDLGSNFISL